MQDKAVNNYFDEPKTIDDSLADYIHANLRLWNACGLLAVIQRAGKRARFDTGELAKERERLRSERDLLELKAERADSGNDDISEQIRGLTAKLKKLPGVAWQDGSYIVFDREEMNKERVLFERFGSLCTIVTQVKPLREVRLNLLVAHEFAHQLSEFLMPGFVEQIESIYRKRKDSCTHDMSAAGSERLTPEQVNQRCFISGYACTDYWEYLAECVAAFSMKSSRDALFELDPEIHKLLMGLVLYPENVLDYPWNEHARQVRAERGINSTNVKTFLKEEGIEQPASAHSKEPYATTVDQLNKSVRELVLETIVRQALAGLPWHEICAGPMLCNNITVEEVEAEVCRRKAKT